MVVLLHGAAGGWDELAIAVVALAVLWGAVKLAGRKPATDDEDAEADDADDAREVAKKGPVEEEEERTKPAHSSTHIG